jgi:uncharacterized protein YbjT (DUF2867 family)
LMTILITGATGKVASGLILQLARNESGIRAMVRSEANAHRLKAQGVDAVLGDYTDPTSLDRAFAGVETALLITPPRAEMADWASAGIAAAKRAGVKRVVRISAIKAAADGPNDNSRQHARTDEELRQSGLNFVILRPHFFMENCLFGTAESIASEGVIRFAMGEASLGMIDARDISDVAVRALLDPRWDGGTYDLTGPASISFHDVAETLSSALGRKVRYVPISPEAAAEAVRQAGGDEWQAEATLGYFRAYSAGWGDFTTEWVPQIAGHPARSFADFAREVMIPALRNSMHLIACH